MTCLTRFFLSFFLIGLMPDISHAGDGKSAYDRVISTNVLRCGYGIFEPFLFVDPNTGVLSGASVDIMEEFGRQAGVKIEWVEEVDWGQIPAALQSGRIDAMCATIWATPQRGKFIGFTRPLFYSTVEAIARADDGRFDNNLAAINRSDVTISTNDGDVSEEVAAKDFPKAKVFAKAQIAGEAQLLLNVSTGKADITFTNPSVLRTFNATNQNALKLVPLPKPIRQYANVMAVDIHEDALLKMIDSGMAGLIRDGSINRILDKYLADQPDVIRRVEVQ